MRTLESFADAHAGESLVVCGCGQSLAEFARPERFITVGVNDVGRLFRPNYLVVVNPRSQFSGDRFRFVEESGAEYVFTQLNLGLGRGGVVRFRLGKYGGTDSEDPGALHYTQNSPYVALCLAAHMGAARIGLAGVDFDEHHFFARTGRHPLSAQLPRIDAEFRALGESLARRGVEVFNLSGRSRLTAFPKITAEEFALLSGRACGPGAAVSGDGACGLDDTERREDAGAKMNVSGGAGVRAAPGGRRKPMRIAVEKHGAGVVGDMFETLAGTLRRMGHEVTREPRLAAGRADTLSVVWNGRAHRPGGPTLYCEHGWLPRWDYQISPRGINADSHLAPFVWDGRALDDEERAEVASRLAGLREGGPRNDEYMRADLEAVRDLPEEFILVALQIEADTNILRHAPEQLRRMQALVNYVSHSNPPLPLVFKQHPADVRRGDQHLRLTTRRPQDRLRPHAAGNVHQILKSGRCRAVVAINSNVVHDALIWGVPAVVLGANVWPRAGDSPFLRALPRDWRAVEEFHAAARTARCREAYCLHLLRNQWGLEDLRDEARVSALVESARGWEGAARVATNAPAPRARAAAPSAPAVRRAAPRHATHGAAHGRRAGGKLINVVARDRGWLFEDLKKHLVAASRAGLSVVASERPRRDADAWVFVRAAEADATPDASRTVVQIHDMMDEGLYAPGGARRAVGDCGGVVLTHPGQRAIIEGSGLSLDGKEVVLRPLGAARSFTLRESPPPRFTVGWVGRPVRRGGEDVKRLRWFVEAVRSLGLARGAVRVVLVGERLEEARAQLAAAGVECACYARPRVTHADYPALYRGLDCLVITSSSNAGPNCLFEALAAGVPVVSTPVGWSPLLISDGVNGHVVEGVEGVSAALRRVCEGRAEWFGRREAVRATVEGLTLESWVGANLDAALRLVARRAAGGLAGPGPEPAAPPAAPTGLSAPGFN